MSADIKVKLGKAIYLGPHNDTDQAGNAVAVYLLKPDRCIDCIITGT